MPYKRIGNIIYAKHRGRYIKKQTCKSVSNAKAALRLLKDLEKKE